MSLTDRELLHGHTDQDTAYVVEDYPYGFRLRTTIRYWVETTKHGDRLNAQTLNPKTARWNKPKRSTYLDVGVIYLDDEGHVQFGGLGTWPSEEYIAEFQAAVGDRLNEAQRAKLAALLGRTRAYKDVTFSVREGEPTPEDDAHQARVQAYISDRVRRETVAASAELAG